MGIRNYLIEGVSCSGKTAVCRELARRGYHALNGDTDLAYQGDPETGAPTNTASHWNHLWDVDRVRALAADRGHEVTFFCGGSRNFDAYLEVFDEVFVLQVDVATLGHRLDARPPDEFGAQPDERALILELHRTGEGLPARAVPIDATSPIAEVVDAILRRVGEGADR